jgi:hypothetical protein
MREAQKYAEEMMRARRELRERDARRSDPSNDE